VSSGRKFLTAEWRNLVLLNYEADPDLLLPFVPAGTELDSWHDRFFVSLVGFQFLKTRLRGFPIPFHSNFEEVNLRFYVRRRTGGEIRRGVVFIREIVPRRAIAFVARTLYNENYVALPMAHAIRSAEEGSIKAAYRWNCHGKWNELQLESQGNAEPLQEGSHEQFIAEHYWGYARQRDGGCVEYQVQHPSWKVRQARHAQFTGSMEELYGREFTAVLRANSTSAFLADGSAVTVMRGQRI
jgi:uncharacterized protein